MTKPALLIYLCQRGIKIKIADLHKLEIYNKIINFFTIGVPQLGGYIKKVHNHTTTDNHLYLPRFGVMEFMAKSNIKTEVINNIKSGVSPAIPFKWTGQFSDNQPIIATHIMQNYFNKEMADAGRSGLILNLEAGQGKTYLATGLIEKIQRKTLVVCHTVSILNQWYDVLVKAYPKNKIARYYGNIKESGDIYIAVINSLLMDKITVDDAQVEPMQFFQQFGYVIFDEIHLYSSKTRKQIYAKVQRKYMLGLSATPDESCLDAINVWNCGPILKAADLAGYSVEDIPFVGDVRVVKYTGHPEYIKPIINEKTEIINHAAMINKLCEDSYRLHLIVKIIFELKAINKNIFVFADRRDYLMRIKEHMEIFNMASFIMDDSKTMKLMGGATADEMTDAKNNANVILTTYAFMGTGVSIPKMDALVLATPRKTKSRQYINRIFRLGGDYGSVRKIVDIVDWNTHMKSQWYKRKKYYDEKKLPISEKKYKWKDLEDEMAKMNILCDSDNDALDLSLNELEIILSQNNSI